MGDFPGGPVVRTTTGGLGSVHSLVGKQRYGGQLKKKENSSSKKIHDEQSIKFLHKDRLSTV